MAIALVEKTTTAATAQVEGGLRRHRRGLVRGPPGEAAWCSGVRAASAMRKR